MTKATLVSLIKKVMDSLCVPQGLVGNGKGKELSDKQAANSRPKKTQGLLGLPQSHQKPYDVKQKKTFQRKAELSHDQEKHLREAWMAGPCAYNGHCLSAMPASAGG